MEPGLFKGGALQRIAGFSLIGFAVLLAVGAALRPGADVEDASSAIQTIADNSGGRWQVAHIVIALSFYALMIGMGASTVPSRRGKLRHGRAWASTSRLRGPQSAQSSWQ